MEPTINRQQKYVIIDVETTGLSLKRGDRIIEIGAVAFEEGHVAAEFNTLVKIPVKIPYYVSLIHGITNEMLRGQPPPEEVYPAFKIFLKDSVLIAHNVRFDLAFLTHEFSQFNISLPHRHICTLQMSRRHFPLLANHKLETVYNHIFGNTANYRQIHRALDDARMVVKIWRAMEEDK